MESDVNPTEHQLSIASDRVAGTLDEVMPLQDRMARAVQHAGTNANRLSKAIGVSRATVSMWLSGEIKTLSAENAAKAARALGVSVEWLSTGRGAMVPGTGNTQRHELVARGQVPIISWVQAGAAAEVADPFPVGVADRWFATRVPVSDLAFALEVRGDSMAPEFPEGTVIVVDPNKEARHGSFVIVRFEDEGEATFKQLAVDGSKRYLRPLNPQYPTVQINGNATIVGVIVQSEITRNYA